MAGGAPPKPLGTYAAPLDAGTAVRSNTTPPGAVCSECKIAYTAGSPIQCPCTGNEKTHIVGLKNIPSYTGDFPSPLQVMWYVPEDGEAGKSFWPDSEIRTWIREAAEYHGVPHVLLAVILQQENGPNATKLQKVAQFGERTLTTFSAIMDKYLWDIVPDRIAGSSSGFANMSRAALEDAARYTERNYGKGLLPHSVRYRRNGWDQYNLISGDDWKADLYYCAAHLRQLIDRETGRVCHSGGIDLKELRGVIRRYNGSGKAAEKYADDAIQKIQDAANGTGQLYFYER